MLFVLANLARKFGQNAEACLAGANEKFYPALWLYRGRPGAADGKTPAESNLEEMETALDRRPKSRGPQNNENFAGRLRALPQNLLAALPETLSTDLARDGQSPPAMVIACADSRVAPEMIFDCAPGDIFVVRNVSNLVPPYEPDAGKHGTSAALEFAVTALNVRSIVVLGHSQCGGIRALMQGPNGNNGDFIASWMTIATKARTRVCDAPDAASQSFETLCYRCEQESIRASLDNLMTFPWVAERVAAGAAYTGRHAF